MYSLLAFSLFLTKPLSGSGCTPPASEPAGAGLPVPLPGARYIPLVTDMLHLPFLKDVQLPLCLSTNKSRKQRQHTNHIGMIANIPERRVTQSKNKPEPVNQQCWLAKTPKVPTLSTRHISELPEVRQLHGTGKLARWKELPAKVLQTKPAYRYLGSSVKWLPLSLRRWSTFASIATLRRLSPLFWSNRASTHILGVERLRENRSCGRGSECGPRSWSAGLCSPETEPGTWEWACRPHLQNTGSEKEEGSLKCIWAQPSVEIVYKITNKQCHPCTVAHTCRTAIISLSLGYIARSPTARPPPQKKKEKEKGKEGGTNIFFLYVQNILCCIFKVLVTIDQTDFLS